ncbi:MAG: hypothetical protein CMF59_19055 [Leptospiraceae bacterium]|nr:hypothetical protein [Leptospiraceae bacterium]|tara:strand:- start:446 stop:712 length:267 start_codon:yes stop_codon:yes gene_type:complete
MEKGPKIVAIVFVVLGILGFTLATGFFSNFSESALVGGAFGIISGLAGALGAMVGNPSTGKSILLAILFSILANVILVTFFQVIWPML